MSACVAVEQAHDREARDALARAGLADDAERLAAPEREREVGDRLDDAVAVGKSTVRLRTSSRASWPPGCAHAYRTRGSRNA